MSFIDPLYDAVSGVIVGLHSGLTSLGLGTDSGAAWGLSIVGLVVIIRIVLIPLFVKQIKAQRGLQVLQPRIKELQKKHKDDRERQSQELMKLYKETGTNPLSSCLPIIAQAPIFFALFHVLNGIAQGKARGVLTDSLVESAAHASIFGAPIADTFRTADTTATKVVTVVMIVAMSLSQFLTQRQLMVKNMPATSDNPFMQQQKILLYVFPVMFAVFGINFPVGVLVYWLTTNLWSMGQQFYVIRRMPAPGSLAAEHREQRLAAKARAETAGSAVSRGTQDGRVGKSEGTTPSVDSAPVPAGKPVRKQPAKQTRAKRGGPPKKKR